jgi:hypothetical protein
MVGLYIGFDLASRPASTIGRWYLLVHAPNPRPTATAMIKVETARRCQQRLRATVSCPMRLCVSDSRAGGSSMR